MSEARLLPEVVAKIRQGTRDYGKQLYADALAGGKTFSWQRDIRTPLGADVAAKLAEEEHGALSAATLFYVSDDMTELALAAARSLPDFRLAPDDLPSPSGFMQFAAPIRRIPRDNGSDDVTAVAWGPLTFDLPYAPAHTACRVIWYGDIGLTPPWPASLCFLSDSVMPYTTEAPDLRGVEQLDTDIWPLKEATLKTAWLLMQQELAVVDRVPADRASARRLYREGSQPPDVRVIRLRHRRTASSSAESHREYHHRWVVRGHWRQQWLPSREVHRPTWIAPHVKGPEDAPLLTGEKVYAWVR